MAAPKQKHCKNGHELEGNRLYTKQGAIKGCKTCQSLRDRSRPYKDNRNNYLIGTYGITIDEFEEMLEEQNHCCAICNTDLNDRNANFIHVDHCHTTGKVRGILCRYCNNGIGLFKDNINNLEAAIKYLKQ